MSRPSSPFDYLISKLKSLHDEFRLADDSCTFDDPVEPDPYTYAELLAAVSAPLVANYPLNEVFVASGQVDDISGNANHGTVASDALGESTAVGPLCNSSPSAVQVNTSREYVSLPFASEGEAQHTVSLWFTPQYIGAPQWLLGGSTMEIVRDGYNNGAGQVPGRFVVNVGLSSGVVTYASPAGTLVDGTAYNLVVVFDGTNATGTRWFKVFLNGVLLEQVDGTNATTKNVSVYNYKINNDYSGTKGWNQGAFGALSDYLFWNGALTDAEVAALYEANKL